MNVYVLSLVASRSLAKTYFMLFYNDFFKGFQHLDETTVASQKLRESGALLGKDGAFSQVFLHQLSILANASGSDTGN